MPELDFPNSPALDEVFDRWRWDGIAWALLGDEDALLAGRPRFPVSDFGIVGNGTNEAAKLQAAFDSGKPLIVPKGVKVTVGAQLIIPSGLDLVIDGRIERNWGEGFGGLGLAMFRSGAAPAGSRASKVRITGNGSVGAPSLTVGGGVIFAGLWDDSLFADISVDTYWGGQAFLVGGDRLRLQGVQVLNSAVTAGTGGIRFTEGDDFVAYGCHIECGDDALQFVPGIVEPRPSCRRGAYIGCTGFSTAGRFMVFAVGDPSGPNVCLNPASIEDCSFIGCHGKASWRGIVSYARAGGGSIKRISFRDCSIDLINDPATDTGHPGAISIREEREAGTTSEVFEDILLDNVSVLNTHQRNIYMTRVNRATIRNCWFDATRLDSGTDMLFEGCRDLVYERNTSTGANVSGSMLGLEKTGAADAIPSDRALIQNNQFLNVKDGSYGVYCGCGTGMVVRGNRFTRAGTASLAAVRANIQASLVRIERNDFTGWPWTNNGLPTAVQFTQQAYVYDNTGLDTVLELTTATIFDHTHDRRFLRLNSPGTRTYTLLGDAKAALPLGEWIEGNNIGAGTWTIAIEAGMTLNGGSTVRQGDSFRIVRTAANTYACTVMPTTPPTIPTVIGNQYAEYPPVTKAVGQIWVMPSNNHEAMWTGTAWIPRTPAAADANMCCILGNLDFYIDPEAWAGGTATIFNLGCNGINPTYAGITQGTDGLSRKYFLHDGVTNDITMPVGSLDVQVGDSFTVFAVKSQAAFVAAAPVWSNRTTGSGIQAGFGFQTTGTAGLHIFRMGDTAVECTASSPTLAVAGQVKLFVAQRNVAADQIGMSIGSDAMTTATDTTTLAPTNPANNVRLGRYAVGNVTRMAMNQYVAGFVKRALTATELTTLKTWAAARYV